MARLVGLRSLAARGQLVPRPPLSSAGHSGWQVVRRRSEERTEASPSSRKLAVVVVNGSTQHVPRLIRASFPSSSDGQREVIYSSEDVVRLSQGYSRLRGITDFDRLLPKFLAQKQFEKQQETRARSGTRRHLNKMGASAVSRREFEIRGKRGVPDVRAFLAEDWDDPKEVQEPIYPRRPWPPAALAGNGPAWFRGRRPLQVLRKPLASRPRYPLTVHLTTHHGAQDQRKGMISVTVPAPPMDSSLHPGLPLAFLPTTPALQTLERPLLRIQAVPKLENGAPQPLDSDALAVSDRRRHESSPAYVARFRELLAAQSCSRVAELGELYLRRTIEKVDPGLAVQRKSLPTAVRPGVEPGSEPVVSVGVFVRTSIKATHQVAAVRFAVRGKVKCALREAIKRDFVAHGGQAARAQNRWQHWVFSIDPNPMVKLLPLSHLTGLIQGALQDLDTRRRKRYPAIGSGTDSHQRTPSGSEQRQPLTGVAPVLGKKALAEAEQLGISPEDFIRQRELALKEKFQRKALRGKEHRQREEANQALRAEKHRRWEGWEEAKQLAKQQYSQPNSKSAGVQLPARSIPHKTATGVVFDRHPEDHMLWSSQSRPIPTDRKKGARPLFDPSSPSFSKKILAEAEALGVSPEEVAQRRASALKEKARLKSLKTEELARRTEANRLKRLDNSRRQGVHEAHLQASSIEDRMPEGEISVTSGGGLPP